jgi:hypothetical protein
VRNGGNLIMAVPHLTTQLHRNRELNLINHGDFTDLFGVKVKGKGINLVGGHRFLKPATRSGYSLPCWGRCDPKFINGSYPLADIELNGAEILCRSSCNYYVEDRAPTAPVLTENRYGAGHALLITSWCWPGRREMAPLMRDLLKNILIGEQGPIRLSGSGSVRYAVYEEGETTFIYLLNTDFDVPQTVNLHIEGSVIPQTIPSGEIKIITHAGRPTSSPQLANN